MEKVAIVTGSSSGIGFETSLALAREGYFTYATMRDTTKSNKIKEIAQKENLKINVLELDVDDEKSVKSAIAQILDQKQRIDVLVNNAGWVSGDVLKMCLLMNSRNSLRQISSQL